MAISGLNVFGIIVATIVGMLLGALWYSPVLFGNQWMKAIGKTKETLGSQTAAMIGSVLASLMTAIGVAVIFAVSNVHSFASAVGAGLVLGLLIIFPALLSDNLFCGWGKPLLLIQSGYRVITVFLMSMAIYFI